MKGGKGEYLTGWSVKSAEFLTREWERSGEKGQWPQFT